MGLAKTCVVCRQKHVKCDGGTPCARCHKYNIECEYRQSRRGGFRIPRKLKFIASDSQTEMSSYKTPYDHLSRPSFLWLKFVTSSHSRVAEYFDLLSAHECPELFLMLEVTQRLSQSKNSRGEQQFQPPFQSDQTSQGAEGAQYTTTNTSTEYGTTESQEARDTRLLIQTLDTVAEILTTSATMHDLVSVQALYIGLIFSQTYMLETHHAKFCSLKQVMTSGGQDNHPEQMLSARLQRVPIDLLQNLHDCIYLNLDKLETVCALAANHVPEFCSSPATASARSTQSPLFAGDSNTNPHTNHNQYHNMTQEERNEQDSLQIMLLAQAVALYHEHKTLNKAAHPHEHPYNQHIHDTNNLDPSGYAHSPTNRPPGRPPPPPPPPLNSPPLPKPTNLQAKDSFTLKAEIATWQGRQALQEVISEDGHTDETMVFCKMIVNYCAILLYMDGSRLFRQDASQAKLTINCKRADAYIELDDLPEDYEHNAHGIPTGTLANTWNCVRAANNITQIAMDCGIETVQNRTPLYTCCVAMAGAVHTLAQYTCNVSPSIAGLDKHVLQALGMRWPIAAKLSMALEHIRTVKPAMQQLEFVQVKVISPPEHDTSLEQGSFVDLDEIAFNIE